MTRVNKQIQVERFTDQHLLAELREIIRIPNAVKNNRIVMKNIPDDFKLGVGHVKYLYNKLLFIKNRYGNCLTEAKKETSMYPTFLTLLIIYQNILCKMQKTIRIIEK